MPADGVKGKTWGPSTLHQRERGQLPMAAHRPRVQRFSKSAPNLPPDELPPPGNRRTRTSRSQVRAPRPDPPKKRSGSHDHLLYENVRARLFCPAHYDTVFDLPPSDSKRKGSGGEIKKNIFKSIKSNSLTGLLAIAGNLSSDTAELLRDD